MFLLQAIFSEGDTFYGLPERSAAIVSESATALHELLTRPGEAPMMAAFTATRVRE
ncbi:MAG: hypothetical protein OQK79_07735 [Rhodanobacter sp.]|nr:hypothetical protein [Rhodanobacter sp.]